MKKIAIFASGSGSNAENIVNFFRNNPSVEIVSILTNKPDAFVLQRLKGYSIDQYVFDREMFYSTESVNNHLKSLEVDFIVLAGFLWLVPQSLIKQFPDAIVNIHPALLPKYGGKGMYGMKVHEAVVEAGDKETGITIHYVNEKYDEGNIIFQAKCPVLPDDSAEQVAEKVHELEYAHFPGVIEKLLK